jgi:hypothetical protein
MLYACVECYGVFGEPASAEADFPIPIICLQCRKLILREHEDVCPSGNSKLGCYNYMIPGNDPDISSEAAC